MNKAPILFALLAAVFMLSTAIPAQGLPWGLSVNPADPNEFSIHAGDNVIITLTGPDGAEAFVEVISSNDTETTKFRFPEEGVVAMFGGILVITWQIPVNIETGLYYAQAKTVDGAVRDIIGFQILEFSGQIITPPTIEERLNDLELANVRLRFENDAMKERIDDLEILLNQDKQLDFVLTTVAIIMGIMAIVAAFTGRSKLLRMVFWNEKEENMGETTKKMLDLLRFWLMHEMPESVGGIVLKVDVEAAKAEIAAKAKAAMDEEPVEESIGEASNFQSREQKGRKGKKKVCDVCGESFLAKRVDNVYCSPKCRLKAYRDRQKEKKGDA